MAYQKLIIQGNIGQIHDVKYTPSGDVILGFSVAYSEGKDKPTTWFNCTAFKKTGQFVQDYFKKGDGIIVEGRIKCEKYKSKEGVEKEAWKVDVDKVAFAGGKSDKPEQSQSAEKPSRDVFKEAAADEFYSDVPF
jgi:single-strand DNA-binding protein